MGRRRKKERELSAEVAAARERIEQWRRTRTKRSPMPEPLWRAAVALAREHGVYRISRDLGVTYETLKSRLTKTSAEGARAKAKRNPQSSLPASAATFVEVKAAPVLAPRQAPREEVVIKVDDGSGAQMRIAFDAVACKHLDVGALVAAFRGGDARGRKRRRR